MEREVTIIMDSNFAQPEILSNVKTIEIKRDNIMVCGMGYIKVYFKNKIKTINCSSDVKIFIR